MEESRSIARQALNDEMDRITLKAETETETETATFQGKASQNPQCLVPWRGGGLKTKAFKDWPETVPVARFLGTCVNSYAKASIHLTLYIERVFDAVYSRCTKGPTHY